jgi:hypothetical protein
MAAINIKQQMEIINTITDPVEKATMYIPICLSRVFGNCCDVPQSGGCVCNCDSTETPTNI